MIKLLKVTYGGSFQCRLATERDPTNASPTDPFGDYGPAAQGWTFRYREAAFDRIIRLSGPVQLRTALVDSWGNAVVSQVECDRGTGPLPVSGDPLVSQIISLGSAKFDTKQGDGGMTREALIDVRFSVGSMLHGDPATLPVLAGTDGSQQAWETEYKAKKPQLIRSSQLDPVRAKVLKNKVEDYASFFQIRCPTKPFALKGVTFGNSVSGVLTQLDSPAATKYDWTVEMAFYRFDGDTLTGKMNGTMTAKLRT